MDNWTQLVSSVSTSIEEPPPRGLGVAGADQWGSFPGTSCGRICMSKPSHKQFINGELTTRRNILMVHGTSSEPGPNGLNSLRRSTMKIGLVGRSGITAFLVFAFLSSRVQLRAQFAPAPAGSAFSISDAQLPKPEALVQLLQTTKKDKPPILQVGSHMLFAQAHIPGSEYAGPGSQPAGIEQLQSRVNAL